MSLIKIQDTENELRKHAGSTVTLVNTYNKQYTGMIILRNNVDLMLVCNDGTNFDIHGEAIKEYKIHETSSSSSKTLSSPKRSRTVNKTSAPEEAVENSGTEEVKEAVRQTQETQIHVNTQLKNTQEEVRIREQETNFLLNKFVNLEADMQRKYEDMANNLRQQQMLGSRPVQMNGLLETSKLLDSTQWLDLINKHDVVQIRLELRSYFADLFQSGKHTKREAELGIERLERAYMYLSRANAEGFVQSNDYVLNEIRITIERLVAMAYGKEKGSGAVESFEAEVQDATMLPEYLHTAMTKANKEIKKTRKEQEKEKPGNPWYRNFGWNASNNRGVNNNFQAANSKGSGKGKGYGSQQNFRGRSHWNKSN